MSKYGLKIRNYEAAVLYETELGVREVVSYTDALLSNSLALDFLKENGLNIYKEKSTRDVICVMFGFGTSSYKEQLTKLYKAIDNENKKPDPEKIRLEKLFNAVENAHKNKDLFVKLSKQELRTQCYTQGIPVTYSDGEKIWYIPTWRTPGKAKHGGIICVRRELYDETINYLRMGIDLDSYDRCPVVEIGAYQSLVTSTIIDRIQIKPEQILIIDDIDRFCIKPALSVYTDEAKQCQIKEIEQYKLKNTMFDGQALIDSSIFPSWGNGYLLLRQHFFKAAAFNTNIQQFFKDYYGDDYDKAIIVDRFGRPVKVNEIKLITTENALKWIKFNITFEYWAGWVEKNGSMFGIVKTAHDSKTGYGLQRASYQMINCLSMDEMPEICEPSMDFIKKLKTDDEFYLDFLMRNSNFSNDYDILVALARHNPAFLRSEYFNERRYIIIDRYSMKLKNGKLLEPAENLVIVGSPYAMLLASVGEDVDLDDTFRVEADCIQCYTERFQNGEYLASFRSPHNSCNNVGYLHNVISDKMKRYFNLGSLIIAVNMNGTDFQDRHNGSDQDSDTIYVTNTSAIVRCAKRFVQDYPTIVNNIPKEANIYQNTMEDFAKVDSLIAASQTDIGESSNAAQLALTYYKTYGEKRYLDYVCILSVVAQIAIDNSKRRYDIDTTAEIKRIKKELDIEANKYPAFWFILQRKSKFAKSIKRKSKSGENNELMNPSLKCPMNYVYSMKLPRSPRRTDKIYRNDELFIPCPNESMENHLIDRECDRIKVFLHRAKDFLWTKDGKEKYDLMEVEFDEFAEILRKTYFGKNSLSVMAYLIDKCLLITEESKEQRDSLTDSLRVNRSAALKLLYKTNPDVFMQCWKSAEQMEGYEVN